MEKNKIYTLKDKRIEKNWHFRRIYKHGKSTASRNSVVYILPNKENKNKIGIAISKKIGNSVFRHKLKRLYKEVFRLSQYDIKQGYDIVIIARRGAVKLDYHRCKKDLLMLFKRLKIMENKQGKNL